MQYSIVCLSEIRKTADFRLDAEYQRPVFIKNSRLVSGETKIKDFIKTGIINIKSSPTTRDFEYLEISNISLKSFDYETIKVAEGEEPDRAHYILEKNDVAVSSVRPARNAVAFIRKEGVIGSSGLAVLRAENIEPEYLFVFCKTNYFIKCLMRANKATMYPAVSHKDILDMSLFVPSCNFREKVKENIQKALSYAKKSKDRIQQARSLLLEELGLTDWRPKHQLSFIKRYSDTERAGRMDAECFQPKYEEIVRKIKAYKGGQDRLGNLTEMKQGVEPGKKEYSEEGVPFVRVSDLKPEEIRKGKCISNQLHSQLKEYQPQTGEILLTKDGSPCTAHHFIDDAKKMIIASGILRLQNKSKKINAVCLTLILNSILVKEQMRRDASGFVILHWKPEQIKETLIPILSEEKQVHIQKTVTESLNLRKKSKKLLQASVQAVEKAIEQDEKSALAWLKTALSEFSSLY